MTTKCREHDGFVHFATPCRCAENERRARESLGCAECDRNADAFARLLRFVQRVANAQPRDFGALRAHARKLATRDPSNMTPAECRGELRAKRSIVGAKTFETLRRLGVEP